MLHLYFCSQFNLSVNSSEKDADCGCEISKITLVAWASLGLSLMLYGCAWLIRSYPQYFLIG